MRWGVRMLLALLLAIGVPLVYVVAGLGIVSAVGDAAVGTLLADAAVVVVVGVARLALPMAFHYQPEPGPVPRGTAAWMVAGLVATFCVAQYAYQLAARLLDTSALEAAGSATASAPLPVQLLLVLIAAPVAEELLLRGALLPWLRRLVGLGPAATVTALVFGVLHGNAQQFTLALVMGLFLAVVADRTRRVWPTIMMHITINTAALTLPDSAVGPLTSPLVVGAAGVVMVLAILRIASRGAAHGVCAGSDTEPEEAGHRASSSLEAAA